MHDLATKEDLRAAFNVFELRARLMLVLTFAALFIALVAVLPI